MADKVLFKKNITQAAYDALGTKDVNTLYFTSDTHALYQGANSIADNVTNIALSTTTITLTYASGATKTLDLATLMATKLDASLKGSNNGVAELDGTGHVPLSQLPGSFPQTVEVQDFVATLPGTANQDDVYYLTSDKKLYTYTGSSWGTGVTPNTTDRYINVADNTVWMWSGSDMVQISGGLALGETDSTAYRGDRGKTAYDHSQIVTGNPHNTTAANVGAIPVVSSPTAGNIAQLTSGGAVADSGTSVSDLMPVVSSATSANVAVFTSSGTVADGGKALADLGAFWEE
jgi:hypothetical protein